MIVTIAGCMLMLLWDRLIDALSRLLSLSLEVVLFISMLTVQFLC